MYNQNLQKQTYYACSVYAFLNVIKYDFGIVLKIDWILKIVIYMEKIGALLSKGAFASIIFPSLIKYVKWKTGFTIDMKVVSIYDINTDDGYILGFKKSNKLYKTLSQDGKITKEDIDNIEQSTTGYGHFHYYKRGKIVETLGGYAYTLYYEYLKDMLERDLYYTNCRVFTPGDERTKKMQEQLISLARERGKFIDYEEFLRVDVGEVICGDISLGNYF